MTGNAEWLANRRYTQVIFTVACLVDCMAAVACKISFSVQQKIRRYLHAWLHINRVRQPYCILMAGEAEGAGVFCKKRLFSISFRHCQLTGSAMSFKIMIN